MADDPKNLQNQNQEDKALQALDSAKLEEEITSKLEKSFAEQTERLKSEMEANAQKIADQKVQEQMDDFRKRIVGDDGTDHPRTPWEERGETRPKDWNEVFSFAQKINEETIEKRLKSRDTEAKKQQEAEEQRLNDTRLTIQKYWDGDIVDLQTEGSIPKYAPAIQDKINKRVQLTKEEFESDPGLRARVDLYQLAQERNITPYKAYHMYYKQGNRGANAPVFGGSGGSPANADNFSYKEISDARKQVFGG